MVLEMLGELNNDLHPMYIYLTFYIALICSYGLIHIPHYQLTRYEKIINNNNYYSIQLQLQQKALIIGQWLDIQSWLTNKMKRKESPDDDEDNHSFSCVQAISLKRGGQTCNLYSLSLKNIVLLDWLY
ncbi:hypothetical protein [Gracilibacillus thailandensis]|uniref:Uncharacterized protein n=1 Tax=Gracilibacillus thailandensis TaxID=563735 RepID=A0A6N7R652_9BACI|nr:hypothetical protein [Gracilibacillus thailandensis]MRI68590.1 hypothetical protein [Gracilibacillus thailandensis]